MSFDEQPDPLSDCMEAFDKMKSRAEQAEASLAAERAKVAELRADLVSTVAREVVNRERAEAAEAKVAALEKDLGRAREVAIREAGEFVYKWTYNKRVGGADIDLIEALGKLSVAAPEAP